MSQEDDANFFRPLIASWYDSLKNPGESQRLLLSDLMRDYAKTRYGKGRNATEIKEIADYRARFPIVDYQSLQPILGEVMKGDYQAIFPEPVLCWVMTRGSTGASKVLPATNRHIGQILTCGSRALINYVLRKKDPELLTGKILNLNFPSAVHTMTVNNQETTYGYSSGTYARLNPALNELSLLPRQEDIDALGPGISRQDWERRFELAYQQALDKNVTAVIGVTPVIMAFARYVKWTHGINPRDLWKMRALFCTSVRKIQSRYAPVLRKHFGEVPVIEIYSATEGVFAQQLDDLPYVTPNFDTYFFEVETKKGVKMLHELERGEWGRLIVSSCLFPRYSIGDLIEAAGKNYFRVFGRDRALIRLEHQLYRLFFGWVL